MRRPNSHQISDGSRIQQLFQKRFVHARLGCYNSGNERWREIVFRSCCLFSGIRRTSCICLFPVPNWSLYVAILSPSPISKPRLDNKKREMKLQPLIVKGEKWKNIPRIFYSLPLPLSQTSFAICLKREGKVEIMKSGFPPEKHGNQCYKPKNVGASNYSFIGTVLPSKR